MTKQEILTILEEMELVEESDSYKIYMDLDSEIKYEVDIDDEEVIAIYQLDENDQVEEILFKKEEIK